jgi:hypothetical protein
MGLKTETKISKSTSIKLKRYVKILSSIDDPFGTIIDRHKTQENTGGTALYPLDDTASSVGIIVENGVPYYYELSNISKITNLKAKANELNDPTRKIGNTFVIVGVFDSTSDNICDLLSCGDMIVLDQYVYKDESSGNKEQCIIVKDVKIDVFYVTATHIHTPIGELDIRDTNIVGVLRQQDSYSETVRVYSYYEVNNTK